jgi:hypothetical protein
MLVFIIQRNYVLCEVEAGFFFVYYLDQEFKNFPKKPRSQFKILGVRRVTRSSFGPQILGARTSCCTPDLGEFQGSKGLGRSFVVDCTETSER